MNSFSFERSTFCTAATSLDVAFFEDLADPLGFATSVRSWDPDVTHAAFFDIMCSTKFTVLNFFSVPAFIRLLAATADGVSFSFYSFMMNLFWNAAGGCVLLAPEDATTPVIWLSTLPSVILFSSDNARL